MTTPPPVHIRRLAPGIKKAVFNSTCGPGAGDGEIRVARGHIRDHSPLDPFRISGLLRNPETGKVGL